MLVDCLTLAMLYTLRIIAGTATAGLVLSFWLLAFSVFLFLSLAFVKRYAELELQLLSGHSKTHGRGYYTSDAPLVQTLGITSDYAAVLVLALYINSDTVLELYRTPEFVWGAVPVMLFWISWMSMQAHRGKMLDDPLVFAVKDDVYDSRMDVVPLRAQVGMVFQKPNPFPKSIYDNVAYGPRIHGLAHNKQELEEIVVNALTKAGLWNEVKDRLHEPGTSLWGGQQQRLCIARNIAVSPDIILMDEPCSALDPIATAKIEQLIDELRENYSIAIVTHSMQQAGDEAVNIADKTLHLCSFEELPPNRELILEIGKIAEQAVDMMRAALKAYDLLDEVPAEDVIRCIARSS